MGSGLKSITKMVTDAFDGKNLNIYEKFLSENFIEFDKFEKLSRIYKENTVPDMAFNWESKNLELMYGTTRNILDKIDEYPDVILIPLSYSMGSSMVCIDINEKNIIRFEPLFSYSLSEMKKIDASLEEFFKNILPKFVYVQDPIEDDKLPLKILNKNSNINSLFNRDFSIIYGILRTKMYTHDQAISLLTTKKVENIVEYIAQALYELINF